MADGTHWHITWINSSDHAGMKQVMLKSLSDEPLHENNDEKSSLDFTNVDVRLPLLVYVSCEKHFGYNHHKKVGTMNKLVRASAILPNGPSSSTSTTTTTSTTGRPSVRMLRELELLH